MENNEKQAELEVPSFMQERPVVESSRGTRAVSERTQPLDTEATRRKMRENYQRTKSQSVKSYTTKVERSTKKKRHISRLEQFKRDLAFFSLGVGVTLGTIGLFKIDDVKAYFEQQMIAAETFGEYGTIVSNNKHLVTDENGKVKYINGETAYWFESGDIGAAMEKKLAEGKDELEVVYGVYSAMVSTSDDVDDFYSAMNAAGLPSEENVWARSHGYENMSDEKLKEDAKRQAVRNHNAAEYQAEVDSMFTDTVSMATINDNKAMGGK